MDGPFQGSSRLVRRLAQSKKDVSPLSLDITAVDPGIVFESGSTLVLFDGHINGKLAESWEYHE